MRTFRVVMAQAAVQRERRVALSRGCLLTLMLVLDDETNLSAPFMTGRAVVPNPRELNFIQYITKRVEATETTPAGDNICMPSTEDKGE